MWKKGSSKPFAGMKPLKIMIILHLHSMKLYTHAKVKIPISLELSTTTPFNKKICLIIACDYFSCFSSSFDVAHLSKRNNHVSLKLAVRVFYLLSSVTLIKEWRLRLSICQRFTRSRLDPPLVADWKAIPLYAVVPVKSKWLYGQKCDLQRRHYCAKVFYLFKRSNAHGLENAF